MSNFWGPKIDKKVINSSTKCLISVKIAILTPHIIPPPLVNIWLIFDLQKYVKWLCMFLEVNPCFQKAHLFCMDLQPAADPYNVVCKHRGAIDLTIPRILSSQYLFYTMISPGFFSCHVIVYKYWLLMREMVKTISPRCSGDCYYFPVGRRPEGK